MQDIKSNLQLVEKSVAQFEKRFALRAMRSLTAIRKRINSKLLATSIEQNLSAESSFKSKLLKVLGETSSTMEVEGNGQKKSQVLPESELYFAILVMVVLLDTNALDKGVLLASEVVNYIQLINRRTADVLAASVYYYYSYFYEKSGKLSDCLPTLLAAQRTASLRRDDETESVLINLLLRNYLHYNLFDQADKLASKVTFPESAGNNQVARYMYYLGFIYAIQLDYTASYKHLMQAIRKSPQNAAAGFKQAASKLTIIVQLLMGEIPERSIFRQKSLQKALIPYFHLTQSVRIGDLTKFQETLSKFGAQFRKDKTYTLILRLRHNVIKTGIRMINLSYSRISLKDICLKLHLDSEEDAEYIVAKAIRDGVIEATIVHEQGFVRSKDNVDIYASEEPQNAFHQRITFCLNIHNECVKAMRYPMTKKNQFEKEDEPRDIEQEISNFVQEMEDDL